MEDCFLLEIKVSHPLPLSFLELLGEVSEGDADCLGVDVRHQLLQTSRGHAALGTARTVWRAGPRDGTAAAVRGGGVRVVVS